MAHTKPLFYYKLLHSSKKMLKGEKTKLSNTTLKQIYALIDEYRQ